MDNYKIIDVLRTINKKELRRFSEFVESPYFNKNKNVIKLFNVISAYHPEYKNRNLTIEKIYSKLFPREKFDYHKINNIISDLFKLAEKYFVISHIEKKEYYLERNIFRELRDKKLYKIYEQKYSAYMKDLIERKFKDEDYYYYLYEMNDEYLWYATIKKPNTELNILQTEFDHFFRFALIRLLRFYNLMLHEQSNTNVKYRLTFLNEIIDFLQKEKAEDTPVIIVFKTILLLLHTKNKKYYSELWDLKEKYFDYFKFDDQYLIYIHLYDYAAYMVNSKGDDNFNKDMFIIYKEMLEKSFMKPENMLYPNLMNIIKISCRVGELVYAEKLIKEFGPHVPPDERDNVLAFCYGTIENSKGNLKEAMKFFSRSNFQNFVFKVQVKILLLKIYYKLNMFEEALAMIDTFKHFVYREEHLLPEHKESYMLFLAAMIELIKIKTMINSEEYEFSLRKIRKDTEKMPANPFRIKLWLQGELDNLQAK